MNSSTVVVPVENPDELVRALPSDSGRGVVHATLLMGSASVVAMVTGIIRTKVFAVLLGPAGIGIYGALQAVQSLAISLADLGLTGAGAREIASARQQGRATNDVQYVLVRLALLFGSVVGIALWLFRNALSSLAFGADEYAPLIAVLGIGVMTAALGGVASALLMGNHRVGALARARMFASVASTIAGVLCVYLFLESGLGWALISIPAFTFLFTWMMTGPLLVSPLVARAFWERPEVRTILTFGGAAFGATVVGMGVQVIVRAVLIQFHGLAAAGEYQAAWGISMLYCGVVLAAIPADYFPRASALADDRLALGRAAVAQARTSVGVAGVLVMLVLLFAPFVIQVVYTADFVRAPAVLQWQVVGDPLRVVWWILSTTLLAAGAVRKFLFVEIFWNACYLAGVVVLPLYFGFEGTGMALPISFLIALPLMLWFAASIIPAESVIRLMVLPAAAFGFAVIIAVTVHILPDHSFAVWIVGGLGLLYTARHAFGVLVDGKPLPPAGGA